MTDLLLITAGLLAAILLVHLLVYRTLGPKRPARDRPADWRAQVRADQHRRVYTDTPSSRRPS